MHVIKKLREALTYSRVEKVRIPCGFRCGSGASGASPETCDLRPAAQVIRLCLTLLKNFLGSWLSWLKIRGFRFAHGINGINGIPQKWLGFAMQIISQSHMFFAGSMVFFDWKWLTICDVCATELFYLILFRLLLFLNLQCGCIPRQQEPLWGYCRGRNFGGMDLRCLTQKSHGSSFPKSTYLHKWSYYVRRASCPSCL